MAEARMRAQARSGTCPDIAPGWACARAEAGVGGSGGSEGGVCFAGWVGEQLGVPELVGRVVALRQLCSPAGGFFCGGRG